MTFTMVQNREPGLVLALEFVPRPGRALYAELARTLEQEISSGRLKPGRRLPGTRSLGSQLGLQRNTVVAAYEELAAEGWIETKARGGSFVAAELPTRAPPPRSAAASVCGFRLPRQSTRRFRPRDQASPDVISLLGGLPDLQLFPTSAYTRALRRACDKKHLNYGDPAGHPQLRQALADMLAQTRGVAPEIDRIVVTRGAQMAISLVAQAILQRGDVVAVEGLGYPPAWEALRATGAKLHPVDVDDGGLCVDKLARLADRQPKLRAVYVTPHHQYPTMRSMHPARRLQLLELAKRHRFAIIEDDYDHEIHYEGQPKLPLASADRHGVVCTIGSLSKVLAPGLRIGWVVAPKVVTDRIIERRRVWDRQGDLVQEAAVAELLEDGELDRHVRRARRSYRQRRQALLTGLATLGDAVHVDPPAGGLALWVQTRGDAEAWAQRALALKVEVAAARAFDFRRRNLPFMRMGFASLEPEALHEAARRLRHCRPRNS